MSEYHNTLASLAVDHQRDSGEVSDTCLDDDSVLAFAQGQLKNEQLEQVHAHIDQCSLCQRLVTEAVHALDAEPFSESTRPSWNAVFQRNTIVGRRYRIIRLIARGGMGEVYEAFDAELQERLALKTVTSTACDNARAVQLLKGEVQLARRISHPNVCRIYDFRTHLMVPSGAAINFLVMEYVDGECLGQRLRESGALPIEQALSIAHQLLLGLLAAHQEGVLHRDFKSDNVMLRTKSDGRVVPVILDFGLAKALNESGDVSSTLNQGQGMVGTLGYMSPEQLQGQPLSMASDIYSFGAVCFELLTGRLPFVGESPVAAAMARLQQAPPAPSGINPEVPEWLDDIVLRCLSRSRAARFNSAQQVLDALALQTAPPSRPRKSAKRGWIAAVLLAIASAPFAIHLLTRAQSSTTERTMPATPASSTRIAPPTDAETSSLGNSNDEPPAVGSRVDEPETAPPSTQAQAKNQRQNRRVSMATAAATLRPPQAPTPSAAAKKPDWLPLESSRK